MEVKKLFLDLDGVLADFDRGVVTILGKRPDELPTRLMWATIAKQEDFFGTLKMMHDAQDLWDYCRPYDPTILTGLPRGKWAEPQKRRWVSNLLGRDVQVITCMSAEKHRWSAPGHILIDDREKLKEDWEKKGGTFILHVNAKCSIAEIQRLNERT
jgi:hypothetical protein